jgi:hypothetical protein
MSPVAPSWGTHPLEPEAQVVWLATHCPARKDRTDTLGERHEPYHSALGRARSNTAPLLPHSGCDRSTTTPGYVPLTPPGEPGGFGLVSDLASKADRWGPVDAVRRRADRGAWGRGPGCGIAGVRIRFRRNSREPREVPVLVSISVSSPPELPPDPHLGPVLEYEQAPKRVVRFWASLAAVLFACSVVALILGGRQFLWATIPATALFLYQAVGARRYCFAVGEGWTSFAPNRSGAAGRRSTD